MSGPVFMMDPVTKACALFDEAPGGGDVADPNSLRNRPLANPEAWLTHVYFHSALNYMEVAFDTVVTVSHAAIAAATNSTGIELNSAFDYDGTTVDWDVFDHSLGYKPLLLVGIGDDLLTPGYPVQVPGVTNGSMRFVTPYVTDTKVFLREYRSRGSVGLAAVDIDYRLLVFRQPPAPTGKNLADFDPVTGTLKLGFDQFDSSRRYLQVVPGGTPFGLSIGRNADAKNGAPRFVAPDGTVFDPVPSSVQMGIKAAAEGSVAYGASMNYTGAFVGASIEVQAP